MTKNSIKALVYVLFPEKTFVGQAEYYYIVEKLFNDAVFCESFAFLLDRFAPLSVNWVQNPEDSFQQGEAIIIEELGSGGSRAASVRECISKVYQLIIENKTIFEQMFNRILTNGNEPCPYWDTYTQPVEKHCSSSSAPDADRMRIDFEDR